MLNVVQSAALRYPAVLPVALVTAIVTAARRAAEPPVIVKMDDVTSVKLAGVAVAAVVRPRLVLAPAAVEAPVPPPVMGTATVKTGATVKVCVAAKVLAAASEAPPMLVSAVAGVATSLRLLDFCRLVARTAAAAPEESKDVAAATAAVPKPRLVLAVAAEARSDKLLAALSGVKPRAACLLLKAVQSVELR